MPFGPNKTKKEIDFLLDKKIYRDTLWLLICSKNTFYLLLSKSVLYSQKSVLYSQKKCFVLKKVKTLLCSENESGSKISLYYEIESAFKSSKSLFWSASSH